MQRGERSDTRIHTNSAKRTAERRSREADRPEGATNASKMTYHQKEPQTASALAQRPEGAKHLRDKYKGQPNGGADPSKWGGEGTHTKSGARERGFSARTEGRNRSEARTREGDGREKN